MAAAKCIALLLLAMAVGAIHAQDPPTYSVSVPSSTGGQKFLSEIGSSYAQQILGNATSFVWKTFGQQWPIDTKNVTKIDLIVRSNVSYVAYEEDSTIYLSADYILKYQGNLKEEVTGILFQEVAHMLMWDANGAAPIWWHGSVTAYVRLTAGLAPSGWAPPGAGDSWARGFDIAARFYQYLDTITPGFVGKLNAKVKTSWDYVYFKDLTGKSVDDLWKDYKAKYGNIP